MAEPTPLLPLEHINEMLRNHEANRELSMNCSQQLASACNLVPAVIPPLNAQPDVIRTLNVHPSTSTNGRMSAKTNMTWSKSSPATPAPSASSVILTKASMPSEALQNNSSNSCKPIFRKPYATFSAITSVLTPISSKLPMVCLTMRCANRAWRLCLPAAPSTKSAFSRLPHRQRRRNTSPTKSNAGSAVSPIFPMTANGLPALIKPPLV